MHLQLVWFCAYVRPYNVNLTADVLFCNGLFLLFLRFIGISILPTAFYMDGPWAATATTGIFLAAAVTDWLDGYLARKMQLGTPFGAFLDPVADKLMVAATLVLLCTKPLETSILRDGPWLLTVPSIAIIGREVYSTNLHCHFPSSL